MQRIIIAAAALLILQIGLAVALNLSGPQYETAIPDTPFATFNPDTVDSIEITGTEGKQVVLRKTESGWVIPATQKAPADSKRISGLLEKLATIKQGLAVATTAGSAGRFKTAEDDFERHIVFRQADSIVADFYLGTAAGIHNTYARKSGQDEVVRIPLNGFDVEPSADKWLDKGLAKIPEDNLAQIIFPAFTLTREDNVWRLEGVPAEETNGEEVARLVKNISDFTVQSVLEPEQVAALFDQQPALAFSAKKNNGTTVDYLLAKPEEEYYVLKLSNSGLYFKIYKWQVEGLKTFTAESLRNHPEDPEESAAAGSQE